MLIDDLLKPLQRDAAADWMGRNDAVAVLDGILKDVEARPLSARDRKKLKAAVIDFLSASNLRGDLTIEARFVRRFAYDYLPIVDSSLKTQYPTLDVPEGPSGIMTPFVGIEPSPMRKQEGSQDDNDSISIHDVSSHRHSDADLQANSNRGRWQDGSIAGALQEVPEGMHFMCTIRRHRSTLSTSYRLFLDTSVGVRKEHGDSPLPHVPSYTTSSDSFLMGSRIRKGGMVQGCSVWTQADSRLWKDRTSLAKITKLNTTYSLKLTSLSTSILSTYPASYPATYRPTGNGIAMVNPAANLPPSDLSAMTLALEGDYDDVQVSTFVPFSDNDSHSSYLPIALGQVAVSVRSRGVDRLLEIHAALMSPRGREAEVDVWVPASRRSCLQKVAAMVDNSRQELLDSDSHLLIRNRVPTAVTHVNGKDVHTVDFGPMSRIKAPSRKNVVMEEVGKESSQWEAPEGLPIFQLGKVEEDVFALDFTMMSPLQAFTMALAILDQ